MGQDNLEEKNKYSSNNTISRSILSLHALPTPHTYTHMHGAFTCAVSSLWHWSVRRLPYSVYAPLNQTLIIMRVIICHEMYMYTGGWKAKGKFFFFQ